MRAARLIRVAVAASLAAASVAVAGAAHADSVRDRQYWLDDYGIRAAWTLTQGAGVTVAVIDTGIGEHSDLAGAVIGGTDFSGSGSRDGRTPVGADSAHGTMVATVLAGRGQGGSGVIGVAPAASLLSISIGFGAETSDSDDEVADAVRWAVDNGARVINMSLTRNTPDWPVSWDDAFLYAQRHDVVVVAAAGNRASGTDTVGAPGTMPGVLAVGGLDRSGAASVTSSSQGITIGVAAPSEQLVGGSPGGGYVLWGGTSGSAPIVSGVVALVRAAHPDLDAANVINRITTTARDAGADGADPLYGFGRLDAAAAVSATVATVTENPTGDLAEWVRLNRRAAVTPAPTTTATPSPVASPVADPGPPAASVVPGAGDLRGATVPVLLFGGFGAAFVMLAVTATLHIRRLRVRPSISELPGEGVD